MPRTSKRSIRLRQLPLSRLKPFPTLRDMEYLMVREALHRSVGNITAAAELLGLSREGLRKKMARLGIYH